jgi:hypothetical protein
MVHSRRLIINLCIFSFHFIGPFAGAATAFETLMDTQKLEKSEDYKLSLLFYPAPTKIDWSSPGAMVRSVARNMLTGDRYPISHTNILLNCKGRPAILTGMSRHKTLSQYWSVLFGGKGLDLLTETYPGYLIRQQDVTSDIKDLIASGRVHALSYKISPATCSRVEKYLNEYKKRNYDKTYSGFVSNPYRGEGAGCAAFSVSTLKVAGLFKNEFLKHWARHITIPTRLMQTPLHSAATHLWGYLFGSNEAWATGNEAALPITVFDPQLMYDWIGDISKNPKAWDPQARLISQGPSLEVEVDRRQSPTPTDDYWNYSWPPTE